MFSSKSFKVFGLTYRSLMHFEFIFVYGVRECSLNYLCILDSNPLTVILFAHIFSHSVACLFILSVDSISVQKLLSLIRPLATMWMDLEVIVLSEVSQMEKDKQYTTSLIWGI